MRTLIILPLAVVILTATLALVSPKAPSEPLAGAGTGSGPSILAAPTFSLVNTGATGPELNIGVASNGFIFVGGWNQVKRSIDGGNTWQALATGTVLAADRVLIVDKDTNRVFLDDTYLGCTILSWSSDLGATWLRNPAACGVGATDHQKVGVGKPTGPLGATANVLYPNNVYVCANGLSHGNCGVSRDGGLTFASAAPHGVGCAFQGAPIANAAGVLYEPTTQCGAQVRFTADSGLSWTTRNLPVAASRDTPDLAITPDGTIYFFYSTNQWKPAFVRSSDGGLTWAGPFLVPVPGIVSSVFPSIVAGTNGRIGLFFYGTTDTGAGWDLNPGNAPAAVRWNGYAAVVTDADAAAPTIAPVQITPAGDPLQFGCLSKLGGCLNNIADYMDIDVGPDGRVYAIMTDGCLPGCVSQAQSNAQAAIVAIQTGGDLLK